MKKISSKIIIFFFLTIILCGAGFQGDKISGFVGIKVAQARYAGDLYTSPVGATDGFTGLEGTSRDTTLASSTSDSPWWAGFAALGDIAAGVWTGPYTAAVMGWLVVINGIVGVILTIIAAILDASIHMSIGGFKAFVDSSSILDSWIIIRDLFNISFIFILLYISIGTIIGWSGFKTKVLIKDVIIGAILINFSFFFTRLIIDGGNILATALYNKLSADGHGLGITGLSGQIMNSLNLQSLINVNLIKASGQTNAIIAVILSIIITCLAIWAFLYGAILFLLRNVMLIFLLAVSPIGFIAGTLPWVKEKSSEWWSALTQQVVMAPFFLFMIYMVIKLVRGLGTSSILGLNLTGGIKTYFTDATALNYAMFIQAFLIIGALLVGTRMTKKMAGKMGGVAEKIVSAAVFAATTAATAGLAAPMAAGATATGANWVTRGVKMASGGSKMGRIGGSVLQKAGTIMTNAGQMKKTLDTATNSSGFLGRTLTAGKKGIFSAVKKETGVDIDFAGQAKKDKKEDDKRAGETLNEINSTKTDEEIANLEAKRKNIADRAEDEINGIVNENQDIKDLDRYLKENAKTTSALTEEINKLEKVIADNATSAADRAAAEIEKDTKKNEVSQFKKDANDLRTRRETIKKSVVSGLERIEVIEQRIADRTGYDLSKHDDKIEELKAKSRVERRAADEYIDRIESRKNIFGLEVGDPKLAAELRKLGAKKYKSKTKAEEYLAELEEKTKKDAEEEAKKASKTT